MIGDRAGDSRVARGHEKRVGRTVAGQCEQLRRAREIPGCGNCSGTFARATGFQKTTELDPAGEVWELAADR